MFYKSLLIIILLICFLEIPLFYPSGIVIYFRLILCICIVFEAIELFKMEIIDKKVNKTISNVCTALLSVFVTFMFLEAIFMFVPRSHGIHYSLAAKLWLKKYYKPLNNLGFRDREPDNSSPVILFVGDSFTAGHGLDTVSERFSNIIEEKLVSSGRNYRAINIGGMAADTTLEYMRMMKFLSYTKIKPKTIVLQYYGNDIESAAANNYRMAFDITELPIKMNILLRYIVPRSYFINYIYWLFPRDYFQPYLHYLQRAYKNKTILNEHKGHLELFINYARQNSINFIVVIFPFLQDIEMSDAMYVDNIVNLFESHNIPTINVSSLVKDVPVKERIVNVNDAHASVKVNKIVADEILKILEMKDMSGVGKR